MSAAARLAVLVALVALARPAAPSANEPASTEPATAGPADAAPGAGPGDDASVSEPTPRRPTPYRVVLQDGTEVPCTEPPVIAFGRVLYKAADGTRHALAADLVDVDATRLRASAAAGRSSREAASRGTERAGGAMPRTTAATQAPDFEARTLDGEAVRLSELRGKVVLVDFWATWCAPCVRAMPELQALHREHADDDFAIVGVSLDRSRSAFEAFVRQRGLDWPNHFDGKQWRNEVAQAYRVNRIPTTVLVDRDGRIAKIGLHGRALENAIVDMKSSEQDDESDDPAAG